VKTLQIVPIAVLFIGIAGCARHSARAVYDGFEGPKLSAIWATDKLAPGAAVFQTEHVRAGRSALKITIHPNDPTPEISADETERDELTESDYLNAREGEAYAYEFSLFVPQDFPVVPKRLVLAQWKQDREGHEVADDNPVIALRYVDGKLFVTTKSERHRIVRYETTRDIKGRWTDFVFHIRHARTNDGFVRVWIDGERVLDFHGPTAYGNEFGYPEHGRFYFKMGLYRDDMQELMTIFIDEYRKRPLTKQELQ
jgi:Polysaccharide lyase